ncbi:50S ribosomal protein L23 [Balamuthia mandrillaris]
MSMVRAFYKKYKFNPDRYKTRCPTVYHFPNIPLTMVNTTKNLGPNKYVFRVQPNLTKVELRNYLTQLYGVKIKKINTMNYEGKSKRGPRRNHYRTARYKKAIVTLYPEEDPYKQWLQEQQKREKVIADAEVIVTGRQKETSTS